MKSRTVTNQFSISGQITADDVSKLAAAGVELLVCNRPDAEAARQPPFTEIAAAASEAGIESRLISFKSGAMTPAHVNEFAKLLESGKRIHAYCRTGNRSFCLYAAAFASGGGAKSEITALAQEVGFDISAAVSPYYSAKAMTGQQTSAPSNNLGSGGAKQSYNVVIVGAGSGGIAIAASLLKRNNKLRIALLDPAGQHFYQPGWTMVGGGVFTASSTRRQMSDLIPSGVTWIKQAVTGFQPDADEVTLANGDQIHYQQLVVCPGLVLDWDAVEGLTETLGENGVTSNYAYDLAPYTWELVQGLKKGKAIFTQPSMPIKCAGAPQKAMYLSCDHWLKQGVLNDIDVNFFNAGAVLFGVAAYVPALQSYIDRYSANLHFNHNLVRVDGKTRTAYFKDVKAGEDSELVAAEFDMMHVCPPQRAPQFVADSELSDDGGWLDVDQFTLRHKRFGNIWGLGDVMNAPNAKTMAAVRKQVPIVAENLVAVLAGKEPAFGYDGYGSCPLTVERGKIVLAEFGYGGKLLPSFPGWMLEGTRPTRAAWTLKADLLPGIYWHAMLKGREWLAAPKRLEDVVV